ncbi:MAG: FGGY family carbohydrate kinase, partial [Planctomycetia bacterium]|nr:FGGY family carbohydrate kinase [Planctomycetia bacterium]
RHNFENTGENMKYVLSYDLGTSGIKASLFDADANCVAQTVEAYSTDYCAGGFMEQKPSEWWEALKKATVALLASLGEAEKSGISVIGVSGHSLGIVAVAADGTLLCEKTPIWSDYRAEKQADEFFTKTDYRAWYEATGCGFPAHLYSVFKILWYRENMPELYEKTSAFIGTKDYINLCLTGKIFTDHSYASGSGVYRLSAGGYDEEFLRISGIDAGKLPTILRSVDTVGFVLPEVAQELGLPTDSRVRVVAGGVDNACMSLGAGCFEQNDTYASLGSSAWVSAITDTPVVDYERKLYTWAHCVSGMFIPSAGIFSAGTSLSWVLNLLYGTDSPDWEEVEKSVRSVPIGSNGVTFCPVMAGGSAVDAAVNMKGALCGMDLSTTHADLLRAAYEGLACELALPFRAIAETCGMGDRLFTVGGGALSVVAREIYANALNIPIQVSGMPRNAAALGAAALALVGDGIWTGFDRIKDLCQGVSLQVPEKQAVAEYEKVQARFSLVCRQQAELAEM